MKDTKTLEQIKVTVVEDEEVVQFKQRDASSESVEDISRITVVEQSVLKHWLARLYVVMRSPALFVLSLGLAGSIGYAIAYLQFFDTTTNSVTGSTKINLSGLNNNALRNRSLDFTNEIRKFLLSSGVEENQMATAVMARMSLTQTADEQAAVWQIYSASSDFHLQKINNKFTTQFRDKARQFRQELLTRTAGRKSEVDVDYLYNYATTPAEFRQIMDDLAGLTESMLEP